MKSRIVFLSFLLVAVMSVVCLATEQITLTSVVPRDPLRARKGAIGNNFFNYSYLNDSNIPDSSLLVEGRIGIGNTFNWIGPQAGLHVITQYGSVGAIFNTSGTPNPDSGLRIVAPISLTHTNWMIGAQQNISGGLEFTPSTAVGGNVFSTPVLSVIDTGRVGIGTSSPSHALDVVGDGDFSNSLHVGGDSSIPTVRAVIRVKNGGDLSGATGHEAIFTLNNGVGQGSTDEIWIGPNTGTPMGYIHLSAPNIWGNGPFQEISDGSLKTGIVTISNALDRVCALRGVNFHWKDKYYPQSLQMGVIAQDVEKIFPEVVTTDREGKKYVGSNALVGALIEAIKEQQKEIRALQAEVAELKAGNGSKITVPARR